MNTCIKPQLTDAIQSMHGSYVKQSDASISLHKINRYVTNLQPKYWHCRKQNSSNCAFIFTEQTFFCVRHSNHSLHVLKSPHITMRALLISGDNLLCSVILLKYELSTLTLTPEHDEMKIKWLLKHCSLVPQFHVMSNLMQQNTINKINLLALSCCRARLNKYNEKEISDDWYYSEYEWSLIS